ncbi:MAG: hypothetical protein JXA42_23850, partial [Anaerolineales bacterium]|nr:hypothetical protein [Anaerolineales bacterium]
PFLGDRIRSFADSAQSSDQTYDWFNVEARNWEGGQSFMDSVPPPGTAARGTIQPPGGSTGGGDTVPMEE